VARHRRKEARHYRALARLDVTSAIEGHESRVVASVAAKRQLPRLAAALSRLSTGERDVLLLVALAQLGYEEVATALGISSGTVGSRLSRARKKLNSSITQETFDRLEHDRRARQQRGERVHHGQRDREVPRREHADHRVGLVGQALSFVQRDRAVRPGDVVGEELGRVRRVVVDRSISCQCGWFTRRPSTTLAMSSVDSSGAWPTSRPSAGERTSIMACLH
jgi:DNA-binding CsgD family transcriptional regulator